MCVDGDVVMMNTGDTATVSVDSGGMLSLLLIFYRMMLFLFGALSGCT